nr:TonB-dependent receptor [Pseudopedobacter sp.]
MKKIILLTISLLSLCQILKAQQTQIKGTVIDSSANVKLTNASISILRAQDSILVKFTRATTNGEFNFQNLKSGNYLLMITYPDYADYMDPFSLKDKEKREVGKIEMILKARLLQEVIFKGEAVQVRMKGDTTEFDAKTFKVQPNAKVEDLLKQLPGIQVDKDGKITAQGQTVNRVLVDGEEFFGDDPTLVTKNIRSDMVDKVQLYDDKSENAKFTGIDDGVKNKTINLKLKDDKKKGYFGKLDLGKGNGDYYSTQGLFNLFDNKKKLSLYSTIGNTKRTGLDWQSSQKYGLMNNNIEIGDDGGVSIFFNDYDQFSGENFRGEGIPKIINTGLHFENKWKEDKHALNFDFKYGKLDNAGFRNSIVQNNLPTNLLTNNSNKGFNNVLDQKKGSISYNFKIDSTSNIKIGFDQTLKTNNDANNTITSGFKDNLTKINSGIRNYSQSQDDSKQNSSLFYGKKFKKVGRTLTFRFNQSHFKTTANGLLQSTNTFFNASNGAVDSVDVIDQLKKNASNGDSYKTSLTFTEKLGKLFAVTANYDYADAKTNSDLKSLNADNNGNYAIVDPAYTNNLDYNVNTNQGGLSFNFKKDKTNITFGSKIARSDLKQNNLLKSTSFSRSFTNYLPAASFEYKFSKQSGLRFNYNGSTSQPTVNQLQPILDNSDPLNITLGNQALGQAFNNRFNIGYNSYKVLSNRSIYMGASFSYVGKAIVNSVTTDEGGKSILRYINLTDKRPNNFYLYSGYNKKLGKSKLNLNAGLNANGNTYYSMINNKINETKGYTLSTSLGLSSYEKKYNFYISFLPGYKINKSSLQPLQNGNGMTFESDGEFKYNLPGKVTINLDYNYEFQEKTSSFSTNFDRFTVNSSIDKKFLKDDQLKVVLSGNDLLNQNVGFNRSVYGNTISQSNYNTIQRYFMLSLIWDFAKFGKLKN